MLTAVAQDAVQPAAAPKLKPGRKWVHVMTNLAQDDVADKLIALMRRAKAAGYNGFVVSDVKFSKFQIAPPATIKNLRRFRQTTRAEGMDFIAAVAPFGYADMFLSNDPNLAEGMPVREAEFVVRDGKLAPFDDTTRLVNGGLEEWKGGVPIGWTVDEPGRCSFRDEPAHEGKVCLRQQEAAPDDKHSCRRLSQQITVKPWHYYHVSVWIKTENCTSKDWRIFAHDATKRLNLNWQAPEIKPTQDWTQYHATFCSIDNRAVQLYLGSWNSKQGKVWFDDVRIEPAGFVNITRRDGTPLRVTSPDGKTVYAEGHDFAAVVDPKLGHDPNPGYFSNWHEPPIVTIPAGSRLKEGDKVLASYTFASTCGKPNNINMCMSEPKTYAIVEQQIRWMKAHGQPDGYMLSHDEIRMNGWDDPCVKSGKTCGQILADNVRQCARIIRQVDPGKPMVIWNDMVDPYHNARALDDAGLPFTMYMAKGNWAGSWEGLPTDVGVVNWNGGNTNSYAFFAKRGNQQIISGADPAKIGTWIGKCKGLPGITGAMYTTWVNDFGPIVENYVKAIEQQEIAKPASAAP